MNALRKSDNHYFELNEYAYDKDGNEYLWNEIILCPLEGEDVNYRLSQEKKEELREKYTGLAMQAIISASDMSILEHKEKAARNAVEFADALIDELRKEKK